MDLRALKKAFQGRRLLDFRRSIAYAVRLREFKLSIGKVKQAIRSNISTYLPSVTLEEMAVKVARAKNHPLPTEAESQGSVTQILESPHKIPEEYIEKAGLHAGGVTLKSIQEFGPLRRLYKDWKLPEDHLVSHDEIILKTRYALNTVPNRDKVEEDLRGSLIIDTPSFESF